MESLFVHKFVHIILPLFIFSISIRNVFVPKYMVCNELLHSECIEHINGKKLQAKMDFTIRYHEHRHAHETCLSYSTIVIVYKWTKIKHSPLIALYRVIEYLSLLHTSASMSYIEHILSRDYTRGDFCSLSVVRTNHGVSILCKRATYVTMHLYETAYN